jgi:hypothetical protein
MSQISGPVSSIAQAPITQKDQAARQDGARETSERAVARQQRLKSENREFVETMAEAAGLKVNPDSSHDADARRRKRFSLMSQKDKPAGQAESTGGEADEKSRAHAAALLSDPDHRDGPTPPPCIIDVKA